ncbi:short-chain dehydrogenase, partial [Pseudomonas syringae]|nr:short-chain dehydrogenase [Pseudomonas syringae]
MESVSQSAKESFMTTTKKTALIIGASR